ncbi:MULTISPECIES: CPBP family intramembrane glutamic endopeptidase [unclassified Clostridium]|uniref:CPBP family intramembrane glutamic endopeptidase n=1 Tax=unclassified Clostridium TaxID=2614128 RepID=UPI0002972D15|nr:MULTISPECIES: CPBP family intramembrane glutamic endopeptidase [unclassified Clostridium]EKQ51291.1 MAG: putative metal-dependent membrane protease [Clostridium sp. Maddingley MBC34-26]
MKTLKNHNSLIISLLKIGILYAVSYTTTYIVSDIFLRIYNLFLQKTNPQFAVGSEVLTRYLNEQLSNMNSFVSMALILIQCICSIICTIVFWRIFEKRKLEEMGLTKISSSSNDLLFGLIIGALSFTLVAFTLLCTKSVELQNSFYKPSFSYLLISQLIVFIFVGISEELFSRGYCINILKQPKKSWIIPIVISAIIFALLHADNPGISALAYINLFLFAIFMGILLIKTKNLWMGIGYHIAWNYFQGDVFGFLVSGIDTASIYKIKVISPNIINGGDFGPEGGIIVTILLIVSICISFRYLPSRN